MAAAGVDAYMHPVETTMGVLNSLQENIIEFGDRMSSPYPEVRAKAAGELSAIVASGGAGALAEGAALAAGGAAALGRMRFGLFAEGAGSAGGYGSSLAVQLGQ